MKNCVMPRPEYPRPQMARSTWLNLNGEWEFQKDPGLNGKSKKWQLAESFSGKITVPFCMESQLSGVGDKEFCDCVWYRKEVEIPAAWLADGKHVFLNIGACDYRTSVYVNGKKAGFDHLGGYISFGVDITPCAKEGKNVIVICAEDHTRSKEQPAGKQSQRQESFGCSYTRTTGIWQTVWLESVAKDYIRNVQYLPNVTDSSLGITVDAAAAEGTVVTAKAYFDGKLVGEATGHVCCNACVLNLALSELHLWELGRGGLYDLELTCGDDAVKSYFGMRTIGLGKNGALVLNGKVVFQRTVLDQGFYPDGIYTASSEQELINDITRSMAMGFNGARLHQKVFEPLFLYHCDRLGYMVWGEHANWGLNISAPTAWKAFMTEWHEILLRDRNHPAIIGWCPLNETQENQDPDLLYEVVKQTKAVDPTRPVIDTSGWKHEPGATDIWDWHDYDQNPETFRARYEAIAKGEEWVTRHHAIKFAPNFISEYGGIKWDVNSNLANAWGYGNAPKSEEEFKERFRGLTEALLFNPFITGLCYTQLTDVEQETNGLYTYDRIAKFEPEFFASVLTQKAACEEE